MISRASSSIALVEDIACHIEIIREDISNSLEMLHLISGADTLIHLAHTTVPGLSMENPSYDVDSNVVQTVGWVSRIAETSTSRIIYFSSGGTVYGIPRFDLIDENHPTNRTCSYGIAKLMNEKYLQMYSRLAAVRCTVLRPSNIYGNCQRLDKCQGLIGILANKALQGKSVEIWGDGKTLRDYIHVDDVVKAVLQVMKYKGLEDVFNLSTGIGVSVLEIVEIMQSYFTERLQVIRRPARRYDVSQNVLDAGRMKREFCWTSEIRLESSIKEILTV